jgi:hypothetical protein
MNNNEIFRVIDSLSFDNPNVALSARQGFLLNQRISQLSLFSVSDGLVPIGGIIAALGVFSGPNNSGTFTTAPLSANNIAASGLISKNGFQLCDGKKISAVDANIDFINKYVPNLTDDRFLKGSTSSGVLSTQSGVNSGNNTVTLTTAQMPSHNHNTTVSSVTTFDYGTKSFSGGTDNTTTAITASSDAAGSHQHDLTFQARGSAVGLGGDNIWYVGPYALYTGFAGSHSHTINVSNPAHSHSYSGNVAIGSHSHTVTLNNPSTGDGLAFDIQPKYITVNYYMRVR